MITLKLATSLDGRIATEAGESRWITGDAARSMVHDLRARHHAVVVGVETAIADDPELTVRTPGYGGPQPARVVLDSRQRLAATSRLASTARQIPTYVVATTPARASLTDQGVRVLTLKARGEHPPLADVVAALSAEGLRDLFVEGGGRVAASFLSEGLVDAVEWFRAPILIGAEGRPGVGPLALRELVGAPRLRRVDVRPLGDDLWERYERI